MVYSYFDLNKSEYKTNPYKHHRFARNRILVTTKHGGWVVLDGEEFEMLERDKIRKDLILFKSLEENGIILTKRNLESIVSRQRERLSHLFNGVSLHIITPTLRCNQACSYCHARAKNIKEKKYDMDEKTAKDVVDFIFESPSPEIGIEFQGGEPLANFPIVKYIIQYSKQKAEEKGKKVKYMLVTNLTMMDESILKYLIKNNVSLCTSFDGPKEVHDKNRRYINGSGTYEDVVYWIDKIKNEYKYPLGALPTITKFSLSHGKDIVDEYAKRGFKSIRIRHMVNAGFANERWSQLGYSAEDFLDFWKSSLDYIIKLNQRDANIVEGVSLIILKNILSSKHQPYTCFSSPCGAALTQLAYDYNGDVFMCDEARSFEIFKLGNVKENCYEDVMTSPATLNIIGLTSGLSSMCDNCVWHPYCGNCLVSSYGQHKTIVPKIPVNRECKIRGGMVKHIFDILTGSEKKSILMKWYNTTEKI